VTEHRAEPSLIDQARAGLLGAAVRTSARPRRWLRPDRRRWQVVLAGLWLVLGFGLGGGAIGQLIAGLGIDPSLGWLLGILQCGPLLIARRWPLAAWRVMVVGLLIGMPAIVGVRPDLPWPWPVTSCIALVVVLFWLAASYDRPTVFGVGALTALLLIWPAVLMAGMSRWLALILTGIVALVLVFGDAVGGRYAAEASLAEQAELRRADLARQAVLEERARIARELHDVVAHHMSVIALQAEAAPYKIADLPPEARGTFATIRSAAVDALAETRRVVGLLRADTDAAERAPQPGLDRLDELVERGRQAGLDVEQLVVGVPRPLAVGVDLSAYRIVQEALSNAARHAPGSRVRVEVGYQTDGLQVAVRNDGTGPAGDAEPDPDGGHGLIGMRERVAMLGGTLSAEPARDGGFAVVARLPYGEEGAAG
jgi:signal transduction histidine kinase